MKKLLNELWTKPFGEYDDKNIRLLALISGFLVHIAGITLLWFVIRTYVPTYSSDPAMKEDILGGSSGGGGGNSKEIVVDFGPSPGDDEATEEERFSPEKVRIIRLKIVRPESQGIPVIAETKDKKKKKQKSVMGSSLAKNFPAKQHVRGSGPGSGGGTGGGQGGGIGKGKGYSIDWGGTGNRGVISGRIPVYPKGTDKEMPVTLQFVVFPDGSVSQVIPITKGDELLERAAITALETWRFDPIPPASDQRIQKGRITFNFKFERTSARTIND